MGPAQSGRRFLKKTYIMLDVSELADDASPTQDVPPTLLTLPPDSLASILAALGSPLDVCRAARVSITLRDAATSNLVWLELRYSRFVNIDLTDSRAPGDRTAVWHRYKFERHWIHTMQLMDTRLATPPADSRPPPQMASARAGPVECSSSARSTSRFSDDSSSIKHTEFIQLVHSLHTYMFSAEVRGPGIATDYLCTDHARHAPMRVLATLGFLYGMGDTAMAPSLAHLDHVGTLAERVRACRELHRRFGCEPPPALRAAILVRWSTWSQLRDCRGFRARDDLHKRVVTLFDLLRQPEHEVWGVIKRGICAEVQDVRLGVAGPNDAAECE